MSIKIDKVVKNYGKQLALSGVSFEVKSGEILGFIGPNGAGKSTLMKIICGFLPPTSGVVTVCGHDVLNNSLEVKKKIGYLAEHNPLYLEMYVREYLEFAGGLHKLHKLDERVKDIINQTGLEREQHKKIGALSKGYRQRVGLAQALIHDPEVLILDEPTTGLDPNQLVEIRNLISAAGKQKTILLSTHIMQEVEAICHRILIINKGEIVANDITQNISQYTNKDKITVLVEFGNECSEKSLGKIASVENVKKVNENTWLLSNNQGVDIRENIFNYAVKNSNSVLSMQKLEKSLEEVFHELTK